MLSGAWLMLAALVVHRYVMQDVFRIADDALETSFRLQIPVKLLAADGSQRTLLLHTRRGDSIEELRNQLRKIPGLEQLDDTHALVMYSKSTLNPKGSSKLLAQDEESVP